MINPDGELVKKKKLLIDSILQYKKDEYSETKDHLIELQDTFQGCKQKTKLKIDAIHDIKKEKNEMFNKYIDSHVQIAYARADLMIIEENKNSLFGIRENEHHFKRMNVQQKDQELEQALHSYREEKLYFENKRDKIFNECVRAKECSRQVASMCRSIKDAVSWQIRSSTGECIDRSSYQYRNSSADDRCLRTQGGRRCTPNALVDHVEHLRETRSILADRVLGAREAIQGEFGRYVKIHRGFDARPFTKHDAEVLTGRGSSAPVNAFGESSSVVDAFFGGANTNPDYEEGRPKSARLSDDSASVTPAPRTPDAVTAQTLSALSSIGAIATMHVHTARSRRSMRGKHIENMGIEKCGEDVLSHCADEGRLARLKALRDGLDNHILYQEAVILMARNTLLHHEKMKTVIHSDVLDNSIDKASVDDNNPGLNLVDEEIKPDLNGLTVTDPEEFAHLQSLLSRIPAPPPHPPKSLIKLSKAASSDSDESRRPSNRKRESSRLLADEEQEEDEATSYLGTGKRYAVKVREATSEAIRASYHQEAALWNTLTSGAVSLVKPAVSSPHKPMNRGTEETTTELPSNSIEADGNNYFADRLPQWVAPPGAANCLGSTELYQHFLVSILEQTGDVGHSAEKESGARYDRSDSTNDGIPIQLAATKLLVLNGSNAKKF